MADHLDNDELVTLCAAFRWRPETWLTHVSACDSCRSALRELGLLHDSFAPATVSTAFATTLRDTIARAASEERRDVKIAMRNSRVRRYLTPIGTAAVVSATSFVTLATVGMMNPLTAGGPAAAGVLALLIGVFAGGRILQDMPRRQSNVAR